LLDLLDSYDATEDRWR